MEDTIEICSGCGKMPRAIDRAEGYFICSRCGNRSTVMVTGDDYENVATELDGKFHEKLLRSKAAEVKKQEPAVVFSKKPGAMLKKPKARAKSAKPKKAKPSQKKTKSRSKKRK